MGAGKLGAMDMTWKLCLISRTIGAARGRAARGRPPLA